jgi:hypothetical protein
MRAQRRSRARARVLGLFISRDLLQHPPVQCARLVDLFTE